MKKCIALILALFMFLSCAAAESAPEADVVWYAILVAAQGTTKPVSTYGVDSRLILRADGTCVSENVSQNGSYTMEGTFAWQDNTLIVSFPDMPDTEYALNDQGYLCYTGASSVTIYTDDPAEYAKYAPSQPAAPEPAAAETEEAFHGLWVLKTIWYRDAQYTPDEANVHLGLSVEPGHITVFDSTSLEKLAEYDTEFVQQGLHFLLEEGTDEEHVLSMLYLTRDGEIMTTYLNSQDEPLVQVFAPAELVEN